MSARLIVQEQQGRVRVFLHREGHLTAEPSGDEVAFEPVLNPQELEDLRWYLEDYLPAPYAVWEEKGSAIKAQLSGWGERLFRSIFGSGKQMKAYLQARSGGVFEIWISSESPAFLGLPWELIRDPDHDSPLALDVARIGRTIPVSTDAAIQRPDERLRILMVISRPFGERDVPYQMIARPLMDCLNLVSDRVELKVLRPPTVKALREELHRALAAGQPYQVLHFDGHGGFSEIGETWAGVVLHDLISRRYASAQGYLLFEDENGNGDALSAEDFALILKESDIPLLALNACRSASLRVDFGPETTVAARLLKEGAASVVAMSYSIYAEAAAQFMALFYEALFSGKTVSQAMVEGRRGMRRNNLRPSPKGRMQLEDWIVPVLYGRREVSFPRLRRGPVHLADSLEQTMARMIEGKSPEGAAEPGTPEGQCNFLAAEGRFFGRDVEFFELERAFHRRRVIVVHGVGGCGKTELAKGFARWLQRSGGLDDARLVFFHAFEPGIGSFSLNAALTSVGFKLYGPDFVMRFPKPEDRRMAILQLMRNHRMLLVWDNFETVHSMPDLAGTTPPLGEVEIAVFRSFLEEVTKRSLSGVIVTSRSPESWLGKEAYRLKLEGLRPMDASLYADWLLSSRPRAQRCRSERAYGELLEYLNGHPLSMRIILPLLEETDPASLLKGLKGMGALPFGFEGVEGKLESLGACIRYSFQTLDESLRKLLSALTLFESVADVQILATVSGLENSPSRFRGADKERWAETLDACVEAGLVTSLGGVLYRLHPALPAYLTALWREQAGKTFEEERLAARRESIRAHASLGGLWYRQIQGGRAEIAMTVLALERATFERVLGEAMELEMYSEAHAVLQALDEFWHARGFVEEAQGWTDRCRLALEDDAGNPPDFDTEKGELWQFVAISEANRLSEMGGLDGAEAIYESIRQALVQSDSQTAHGQLATLYHELGMVAQQRWDLSSAENWYNKSLEINEALGNGPGTAVSYYQLGIVSQRRGNLSDSENWCKKALKINETLGHKPGLALNYAQLGRVAMDRGDFSSAENWYKKSLGIRKALGHKRGMAESYNNLGILAEHRGDSAGAESCHKKALEIYEALGYRHGMAASYHQLGNVAERRGDLSSAESWYKKALEINGAIGNRSWVAMNYYQLGMVAQHRGDLPGAESLYKESLEIREALGDRPEMAASYHQLGMVAQQRGDFSGADDWYKKSLLIKETIKDRPGMARTYAQLGLLSEELGDLDGAFNWAIRCVALFPDFPHHATGSGPRDLVRLAAKLGMQAVEHSWLQCTGMPLPDSVRRGLEQILASGAQ